MRERVTGLLVLPGLTVIALCFVMPMVFIFWQSFQPSADALGPGERYLQFAIDPFWQRILSRTVYVGLGVTAITLVLGYPVAYCISRSEGRMRRIIQLMIFFPLITSAIVRTFGWMILISQGGFVNIVLSWFGLGPIGLLNTDVGILIGLTHILLPFMILTLLGALNTIDPVLEAAASSLGSSPFRSFMRVTLPMSLPGIVAGSLLVFALAVSAFVTPALLGGIQSPMMATMIYREAVISYNVPSAAAGAVILLVGTSMLIYVYQRISGKRAG